MSELEVLDKYLTLKGYADLKMRLVLIKYHEPIKDEDGVTDNFWMHFTFERQCYFCNRLTKGELDCTIKTTWEQFKKKFHAAFAPRDLVMAGTFCTPGACCYRLRGKNVRRAPATNAIMLPQKVTDYLKRWEIGRSIEKMGEAEVNHAVTWRLDEPEMTAADLVNGLIERWIEERELEIDERRRMILVKKLVREGLERLAMAKDGVEDAEQNWMEAMGEVEEMQERLEAKSLLELLQLERLMVEGFPEFRYK